MRCANLARALAWLGIVSWLGAGCTLLLDRSAAQCHSDNDCTRFPGKPTCDKKTSLCLLSELKPTHCVSTQAPSTELEFLNRCSTTALPDTESPEQCLSYDNCKAFKTCDAGVPGDFMGPSPDALPALVPLAGSDGGAASLPNCAEQAPPGGGVLYMSGSSNFIGLLTKLAPIIIANVNLTPVFKTTDSCTGARSMYPCTPGGTQTCVDGFSASDHYIRDPASGSTGSRAQYFDGMGPHECLLGSEREVDIGESEVYAETCGLAKDMAHVNHTVGPVLPILFVVPRNSKQRAISTEAARAIFGNGPAASIEPWIDPLSYYVRGPNTATTRLIGRAIGVPVPPNRFWGIDQLTAQRLYQNIKVLTEADAADKAIGLLGSDTYDADRLNVRALAFRAKGQLCAYVPDSSLETFDKINVRDGHYPIWGNLHFFAAFNNSEFKSSRARDFIDFMSRVPIPTDLFDAFIKASWVPRCAMMVQHDSDLSPPTTNNLSNFPCGCYFDAHVQGGKANPATCKTCTANADCLDPARPSCNYGFCERSGS